MKRLFLSLFFIIIIQLSFAKEPFINDIEITGNSNLSTSQLKKQLAIKDKKFYHSILFFLKKPIFDEFELQEDLKRLKVYYQERGFLYVDTGYDLEKQNDYVNIIINIDEGTPILLKNVNFEFSTGDSLKYISNLINENSERLSTKSGDIFEDLNIRKSKKIIYDLLINNGYPNPEINFDLKVNKENNTVDVTFEINAGEFCKFGDTILSGNNKTADKHILKQIYYQSDETYNFSKLVATQRSIQNMGLFRIVTIKTKTDSIVDNKLPIEIIMKESPFWSFKFGVGYGLEEKFRVSGQATKLGFFGGTRKLTLYAKHSFLEPINLSAKVTQRPFIFKTSSISLNPFFKLENEEAYDLQRLGVNLTYQQSLTSQMNYYLNYKFEKDDIEMNKDLEEELDDLAYYYNKSNITLGISFNSSNPPFFPTKGFGISFVNTYGGLDLNSKYHYTQHLIEVKNYLAIFSNLTLATRVKIGGMKPILGDDETPIEERFYAGGSTSIRGWTRGDIGPKEDDLPVGGNSYIEYNLEFRQKIWKMFYLAVFGDVGNVWEKSLSYDNSDLKKSLGAGLRIDTPIGPVRFDAAQPINDSKKQIQIHLSIGQAF